MIENPGAVEDWLSGSAPQFAWLVDVINCVLDPDCIVLGGQMPEPLLAALFAAITAFGTDWLPQRGLAQPRLVMGSGDVFSVAAGAAAYPIARAFDPSLSAIEKANGASGQA